MERLIKGFAEAAINPIISLTIFKPSFQSRPTYLHLNLSHVTDRSQCQTLLGGDTTLASRPMLWKRIIIKLIILGNNTFLSL